MPSRWRWDAVTVRELPPLTRSMGPREWLVPPATLPHRAKQPAARRSVQAPGEAFLPKRCRRTTPQYQRIPGSVHRCGTSRSPHHRHRPELTHRHHRRRQLHLLRESRRRHHRALPTRGVRNERRQDPGDRSRQAHRAGTRWHRSLLGNRLAHGRKRRAPVAAYLPMCAA